MKKFGSDLVVDLLRAHRIPYVPMNPGASFRGLHDSLVNWGSDDGPEMIICTNEKIAVNMAHGYAKVTGEPLAAIVHDVVGLMQGTMGVYTSYVDQVPVLVLGGTGPMAVGKRRPHIEWVHTAFPQGGLVRDFVKWDDQPFDAQGVVDGFARGYQIATTEPGGPVYLCYDVAFQEEALEDEPEVVVHRPNPALQFPASEGALLELADAMLQAERPVIVAGRVGRHPAAASALGALAELAGVPVLDQGWRFNMPITHPMRSTGRQAVTDADLVVALDVVDLYGSLTAPGQGRGAPRTWLPAPDARLMEVRLDLLGGNGWLPKQQKYQAVETSLMANTALALPALLPVMERRREELGAREATERRSQVWSTRAREHREKAQAESRTSWNSSPVSTARLASELWEVVRHEDFVVTGADLGGWLTRLWDLDQWSQYHGRSLGTATQIGTSMGIALAHRNDSTKVVVNIQPDGDLLFDPGALWTIAHYKLPMLLVLFNNRAYYNDWEHQAAIARDRGRDVSRAHIGLDLDDPAPDFATLARSFGIGSAGPVVDPDNLGKTLADAFATVRDERVPFLVDVLTQHR